MESFVTPLESPARYGARFSERRDARLFMVGPWYDRR